MGKALRVLVVDDHALFRRGVVELLRDRSDFVVVGEANSAQEAVALSRRRHPQVVLMDVHMPGVRGFDVIPLLKHDPDLRVLMLTISDRDDDLMGALAAGADGYLLKNAEPEELCQAIQLVAAGQAVLAPEVTGRVIRAAARAQLAPPSVQLSQREREVLAEMARGATTAEIAVHLILSPNTVKTHVRHILEKLDASNRAEAISRAAAMGLLDR